MATKSPSQNLIIGHTIEMEAEAAITAKRLVKLGTAPGQVIHTAAITDVVAGVALNSAAAGARVTIQLDGIAEVACKTGVTYLDQIMPDGGGAGLCATAAGITAKSCGQAGGTTTTAEGEIQKVWLRTMNVNGIANS
jgi:hypothetical protein